MSNCHDIVAIVLNKSLVCKVASYMIAHHISTNFTEASSVRHSNFNYLFIRMQKNNWSVKEGMQNLSGKKMQTGKNIIERVFVQNNP